MISCSQCWYLKSPKQTRNYPKSVAPILKAPPTHTYTTQATISSVKQSKTNVTHLSRFKVQGSFIRHILNYTEYIYIYIYIYIYLYIFSIEKKQSNLCIQSQNLLFLEFSPALESWSDIYTGPTSCLIVTPVLHWTWAERRYIIL